MPPRERTAIEAQATLLNVKSGKPEPERDRYGYASSDKPPKSTMELTFKIELPGPKTAERFSKWKGDWSRRDKATRALKEQHQKAAPSAPEEGGKAKRKARQDDDGYSPSEQEIVDYLKPRWEAECATIARHNTAAMNRAAVFGMFFALVNSTVQLTIAPVQQPMELLPAEEELPALAAGEEEQQD